MDEYLAALTRVWDACPLWIRTVLILGAGLALAFLIRLVLSVFLRLIRFDRLNDRLGVSEFLRKGGVVYTPAQLMGVLAFWLVLLMTFMEVSRWLDIGFLSSVYSKLTAVIPGLIAAVLVGIVGWVLIAFLANFAVTIARNTGFVQARLLGKAIRYVGVVIVFVMALDQVQLGGGIFVTMLLIAFAAGVFGVALAFGLGCKDIARDAAQKTIRALRENSRAGGRTDLEG